MHRSAAALYKIDTGQEARESFNHGDSYTNILRYNIKVMSLMCLSAGMECCGTCVLLLHPISAALQSLSLSLKKKTKNPPKIQPGKAVSIAGKTTHNELAVGMLLCISRCMQPSGASYTGHKARKVLNL